jgi:mRNA-degrading endonuclease RelE of RelBE toxin-antitoxin system
MAAYALKQTPRFAAEFKRLTRKFRRLERDWERFVQVLCDRPWEIGDQFPGVHPPLSKARMAVPSAGLSKRDGCRVLYRIDEVRHVVYVAITDATVLVPLSDFSGAFELGEAAA